MTDPPLDCGSSAEEETEPVAGNDGVIDSSVSAGRNFVWDGEPLAVSDAMARDDLADDDGDDLADDAGDDLTDDAGDLTDDAGDLADDDGDDLADDAGDDLADDGDDDLADDGDDLDAGFGLLDVVEAFTAMRHEWRTQARETRAMGELISRSVEQIEVASRREPTSIASDDSDSESRHLAEAVAEIESTVDRAVAAASRFGGSPTDTETSADSPIQELDERFSQMGPFRRWLAGPWHRQVIALLCDRESSVTQADPVQEGLLLMRERVRRLMRDCGVERHDVQGKRFDAEWMNAVDTVVSNGVDSGHVTEQLRPAYTWNGKRIKYADVRIAR